jgi:hypothetical protein
MTFLSAEKLSITDEQRAALILTYKMMLDGTIKYLEQPDDGFEIYEEDIEDKGFTGHFHMAHWHLPTKCGTVCCIGGTAELVGGVKFDSVSKMNDPLYRLFYCFDPCGDDPSLQEATLALENYLHTGEPQWEKIADLNLHEPKWGAINDQGLVF